MNYSNTNIQSNSNKDHNQLKNEDFLSLHSIFRGNNWELIKNEMNYISYSKFGDETTSFDIKVLTDKFVVSIPLKNSIYQYVTSFNNCCQTSEYIEQNFLNYIV